MREITSIGLGFVLLTVGLTAPLAAAGDAEAPGSFEAYLDAAEAAGIEGDERHIDALVPSGMGLEIVVDLDTFDVETSSVAPVAPHGSPPAGSSANCLVLEAGEEGGLTPGEDLHVEHPERPEQVPGCQDDDVQHTTGTDEMQFVTAGDDEAMFRLQRDWDRGWGWVWIECSTSESVVNLAVGPYDGLVHVDCYVNNYGNPATWTLYEAYVDNDHSQDGMLAYGAISYVE